MRTRDEVLRAFSRPYQSHEDVGGPDADAMADEIVRLRDILATVDAEREQAYEVAQKNEQTARRLQRVVEALREPSEAVKAVADATYWDRSVVKDVWEDVFSKAVEEAEREVAHD